MKRITMLIYILSATVLMAACSNSDGDERAPLRATNTVLVAGLSYISEAGGINACYWKNGVLTGLYNTEVYSYSEAYQVTALNDNIYVSGNYYRSSDNIYNACYWINDRLGRTDLGPGRARGIHIEGDDIYVAGHMTEGVSTFDTAYPCYWRNGVLVQLGTVDSGWAMDVDVNGSDVYVSGREVVDGERLAGYWLNGVKTDLTSSTGASTNVKCIEYENGNLHAAGTTDESGDYRAVYWLNDSPQQLPIPTDCIDSYATGMFVNTEGVVYVSGYCFTGIRNRACYWLNGALVELETADESEANSVYEFEGSVYVTGNISQSFENRCCIWKDGVREIISTEDSNGFSVWDPYF